VGAVETRCSATGAPGAAPQSWYQRGAAMWRRSSTPGAAVVVSTPSWPLSCLQLPDLRLPPRARIGRIRLGCAACALVAMSGCQAAKRGWTALVRARASSCRYRARQLAAAVRQPIVSGCSDRKRYHAFPAQVRDGTGDCDCQGSRARWAGLTLSAREALRCSRARGSSSTRAPGERRMWSGAVWRPLEAPKPDRGGHHTPDHDDQQVVSGPC
jgi:hypothetical protein